MSEKVTGFDQRLRLLKASEIAKMLNVSKAHVYNLIASGNLPSVQVGQLKRVRPEDLEIFIERNLINSWNQIAVK